MLSYALPATLYPRQFAWGQASESPVSDLDEQATGLTKRLAMNLGRRVSKVACP